MAPRCFDFDRLGVMVCWRELMVIVKRFSVSLLAAGEEGEIKNGNWGGGGEEGEGEGGRCWFILKRGLGFCVQSSKPVPPPFFFKCFSCLDLVARPCVSIQLK